MNKKILLFLLVFASFQATAFAQLIDKNATLTTKKLFANLQQLVGKEVLFGHQDDMAYGVGWKYEPGRSDIKDLSGQYPAVFGWELAGLERESALNIDGVPFTKMRQYIKKAYDLGALNTISWHMDNPLNLKSAWDTTGNAVSAILPKGAKHQLYKSWLDQFALFARSLKGSDGKLIPILFRPFHEHSGGWFWWGAKSCSPQQYQELWRFTVKYLRDVKQLHQLIYVFNPCDFNTEEQYLQRYPGDAFADVLSFDAYQHGTEQADSFKKDIIKKLAIQDRLAKRKKKLSAIAEIGFVEIPMADWWSTVFVKAIAATPPSYALFWRNAGYREKEKDNHYYAPYPGQKSAQDFIRIWKEGKILLQGGLKKYAVYR